MAERAYTVAEIDALRRCHENKFLSGYYGGPRVPRSDGYGRTRSYIESEKTLYVEERVRTSMMAGHTAQDLLDSDGSGTLPMFMRPADVCHDPA